jgi:hypothetical protein
MVSKADFKNLFQTLKEMLSKKEKQRNDKNSMELDNESFYSYTSGIRDAANIEQALKASYEKSLTLDTYIPSARFIGKTAPAQTCANIIQKTRGGGKRINKTTTTKPISQKPTQRGGSD